MVDDNNVPHMSEFHDPASDNYPSYAIIKDGIVENSYLVESLEKLKEVFGNDIFAVEVMLGEAPWVGLGWSEELGFEQPSSSVPTPPEE